MKITKAMGRACLRELERIAAAGAAYIDSVNDLDAENALARIGWCDEESWRCWFREDYRGRINAHQVMTALAMCAAIAGVKP